MVEYTVKSFNQTCSACPSQWDIFIHDGPFQNEEEYIYARYRWGCLTVTLYNNDYPWGSGGKDIFYKQIGGEYDGILDTEDLIKHTKGVLDWSEFRHLVDDDLDDDNDEDENDKWWNSLSYNMKTLIRKEYK